jgi:hypothetical protein
MSASEQGVLNAQMNAAMEQMRPSVLYRPEVYPDGDQWCALYGKDIQTGVCGFGKTPAEAVYEFDKAWMTASVPGAPK